MLPSFKVIELTMLKPF